jgi:hypothetical protein
MSVCELKKAKTSTLRDTVGKPARMGKIKSGGSHVFKNSITLADAGRHGTDREEVVSRK